MISESPNNWIKVELKEIANYVNEKISIDNSKKDTYISTTNMLSNKGGIVEAESLPKAKNLNSFKKGDILISNIRPYFKKIWFATFDGTSSGDVLIFRVKEDIHNKYLYYVLSNDYFFEYTTKSAKGTKMPRGDKKAIMQYLVPKRPITEQKLIADTLSALDDKIERNNKINKNLEQQAQEIFKHWFVDFEFPNKNGMSYKFSGGEMVESKVGLIPEGWEVKSLIEIAEFLNGVAIARYKPVNETDNSLPAVKIRELRQGYTDGSSDRCLTSVDSKYIIDDFDMIFSWSGSLLIDIWVGSTAILNQHLFKVTSKEYDQWYYYYWTKHFLDEFIQIAKSKATTMGHINRSHLSEAKVLLPDPLTYKEMGKTLSNILNLKMKNQKQNQKLSELRDILLPKLMSGELRIPLD